MMFVFIVYLPSPHENDKVRMLNAQCIMQHYFRHHDWFKVWGKGLHLRQGLRFKD